MTSTNLPLAHVRRYGPAVIAAGLMSAGIRQLVSAFTYLVTGWILELINAIIRRGFRDQLPLAETYGRYPAQFYVELVGMAVIALVLGLFVGKWAHARAQRWSGP